jgi:hypothetical protein
MTKRLIGFVLASLLFFCVSCGTEKQSIYSSSIDENTSFAMSNNLSMIPLQPLSISLLIDAQLEYSKQYPSQDTTSDISFQFCNDDGAVYILSNQGFCITHQLSNHTNHIQNNPLLHEILSNFSDVSNVGNYLVVDRVIDRNHIQSVSLDKNTLESCGTTTIFLFTLPYYSSNQYLYRIGTTWNGGEYGLSTQGCEGNLLWTYPEQDQYGSFYPLQKPYEKDGIFHILYIDFVNKSFLKHIAIESSSGQICIDEQIAMYDENGWWESLHLNPCTRVVWKDPAVFFQGYDTSGVYVMKCMLQENHSLQVQWKKYISDESVQEKDSHILDLHVFCGVTSEEVIAVVEENQEESMKQTRLVCLDVESGEIKWKTLPINWYSTFQIHITKPYLLLKTDSTSKTEGELKALDSDCITAFSFEDGSIQWQIPIRKPLFDENRMCNDAIYSSSSYAYYTFHEKGKILSRIEASSGTYSQIELPVNQEIAQAEFYHINENIYLFLQIIEKDTPNNCLLFQINET